MEIVQISILVVAFVSSLYFTGKTIYHMFHMINNITGKYANFLAPFVLFMPSQFNEEGNKHRIKFYPSIIGVAVSWGVIFIVKGILNA